MRPYVELLPVMFFGIVTFLLTLLMFFLSYILRPHNPQSETKLSPYECGQIPVGEARLEFPYSYYLYAIVFTVVDVLSSFLFILAASTLRENVAIAWATFAFIVLLAIGVAYSLNMIPKTMLTSEELIALREGMKSKEN
nr:NADH-quinone oxidoreductase subunit A [Candidatus Njordarchaeota archaeon]